MKKYIILIAALVAALACNRQPAITVTSDLTLLSFTVGTEGTKTSLNGKDIVWSTSDRINVFSGASFATNTAFSATSVENSGLNATFEGLGEVSPEYYALFPYQNTATISPAGVITAELPAAQAAVPSSFGPEANLSVAYIAGTENLQFKNVGALLGVTVPDAGLTGLKVESLGGQPLTGTAQITYNGGEPAVNITNGNSYVETAVSGAGTYYFVVFPGSYSDGFRITLTKKGYTASVKKDKALTLGRNDNVLLTSIPSVPDDAWKVVFTPGEKVYIKGIANTDENGQEVSYIRAGYYDPPTGGAAPTNPAPGDRASIAGVTYNYEVWTKIAPNDQIYFESENGARFAINVAGDAVAPIADNAVGPRLSVSDTPYRIRINLPSGEAQLLRVGIVNYSIYAGNVSENLSYDKAGVWKLSNYPFTYATNQSWDPMLVRYRFSFWFNWIGGQGGHDFDVWQTYGNCTNINNSNLKPQTADPADGYYYLQPFTGDDWETIFYLPDWLFDSDKNNQSKKGTINLYMNNTYSHFTHGFSDVVDNN